MSPVSESPLDGRDQRLVFLGCYDFMVVQEKTCNVRINKILNGFMNIYIW